MMRLRDAHAFFVLKSARPEELQQAATEALVDGLDSESLRLLAGLGPAEMDSAGELFGRALTELDLPALTKAEAARQLARSVAKRIVGGTLTPRAGAELIWDLYPLVDDAADFHDLDPFVYAASEMRSRPQEEAFFQEAILREARRWADG